MPTLMRSLLPLAIFGVAAAHAAQFKFATQTLTVPDGFTVEQVAGPPLVNRPISIAYDERGRLYATDSSGLSERAPIQFEQKPHRIVRLDDTDGDGRFDRATTFADKMMFPQGALFHDDSLYVAAPPHIWKLTDTDDDGVADRREVWWDGGTLTGCANDVHGPYLGPDGWFYWTKGAFAEQKHTVNGQPWTTRAAHIFRARPDGSHFEPVMTGGMDNPVGIAFTASGERILSGTFFQTGAPGKRDGLIHALYGGVYGKENAATAGHPRTGDLMPVMTHMGAAAPCGSTTYRAGTFGREYEGSVFVCYFNLRKISRHQLTPAGATYRTVDTDFVTSDSPDFRPTDVLEDADGSLLVVDTGAWYKICCPTSQLAKPDILGGIYRIRKTDSPSPADPRGLALPWSGQSAAELAKRLADARPYVVDRAQYLLGQLGAEAVPVIREHTLSSPLPSVRRQALWALARIDSAAAREAVRGALSDQDSGVVQVALHVCSLWRDAAPQLPALAASKQPEVVRAAAEALGRGAPAGAVSALLAAIDRLPGRQFAATGTPETAEARSLEHALIYALIQIGDSRELLARLKSGAKPSVVRAALVALDQMPASVLRAEHVLPWLDSSLPMLRSTAGWIVAGHADWGSDLAGYFQARLTALAKSEAGNDQASLQAQLAQLAKAPAIQTLLANTAQDREMNSQARLLALRAMAGSGLKETPAVWLDALSALLPSADVPLQRQAVTTAHTLPLPKAGHAALTTALAATGRDARVSAEVRLEALSVAPGTLGAIEPELFDFLRAQLDGKKSMASRGAAAGVLARATLSPAQQLALTEALTTTGALETPKLLPAFERAPTAALGHSLVAALAASPGLPGVRANVLKTLLAKYPPAVQQEGDALLARLNAEAAQQNAHVDELLAATKGGDLRRGQAVFNSEKTACILCHMVGYQGGRLGPDLTNIGRIRNERELLEAIAYPSATFVRGYEPMLVTTKSGETHSGIVRKDAPDEVVLATGPESEQHVARSEIADMQPGAFSPMPPGFAAILSTQELADLLAFLKSRQ